MNEIPLSSLRRGEKCTLCSIGLQGGMGRRLRDLGLIPGTRLECAFTAPSGSPMAFWIRGALIALRRDDCRQIIVGRAS